MASKAAQLVIGDDASIGIILKRNKATFNIDSGATVKGQVTSMDHKYVYTSELTALSTDTGADWPNSLVVFPISSTVTSLITYTGMALVEIQVDDGGKTTFFAELEIIKGAIA